MKNYLALLILVFLFNDVWAHKLNVFAFVEGDKVNVEGYFSDGILAKNAKVTVTDLEGNLLQEGRANEEGQYQYQATQQADNLIKIDAGLGHVATYQLGADSVSEPMDSDASGSTTSAKATDVQKAVSEAIKPLAREIAELKQKSGLSDIIGGIGYILGILGLFAYLKYRKETQSS